MFKKSNWKNTKMKHLKFVIIVFILLMPFRTYGVNSCPAPKVNKDSIILKCREYEVLDTLLLDKMLADVQSRYCAKYLGLKIIRYSFSEDEKHIFEACNCSCLEDSLTFGHVFYKGLDIFIPAGTSSTLFKRKKAKNVVVVKEGRLSETCCMLFNYDLNGLFLEGRDLTYRDYLKWDSYKYEIADTALLDKMLEDVQLRYCTKCSELKVIQYIYSSKENKHTFRTYNKFGTEQKFFLSLALGHVSYKGVVILIPVDTPEILFKKNESERVVIAVERAVQCEVCEIWYDYDEKGIFLGETVKNEISSPTLQKICQ